MLCIHIKKFQRTPFWKTSTSGRPCEKPFLPPGLLQRAFIITKYGARTVTVVSPALVFFCTQFPPGNLPTNYNLGGPRSKKLTHYIFVLYSCLRFHIFT